MRLKLFPFQEKAVRSLHVCVQNALRTYRDTTDENQIISLQAATGAGKTIIMAAFIEQVYHGTENTMPNQNAIFVWLSDSPSLNDQSRAKLDQKADLIRFDQCVTIDEASFDQEILKDGKIYFLNTQKLAKSKKLDRHSDSRQYTIWETLDNTAREKSDRLYFIIDEAHRGMQGIDAGKATSIMQRFIKGYPEHGMQPMPLIIGMSATPERFQQLVNNCQHSNLRMVKVSVDEVRASGLLKDRILVKFPGDTKRFNETVMLQAATKEWLSKCDHWRQYTKEQHYANVDPVFVVQVAPADSTHKDSTTDLNALIATIEETQGRRFDEHEVVHTFGSTSDLTMNGLTVHPVNPEHIADDHRIRVVLFKENLSTGWDCPRAETMMSFRHAQDATYIAQLLGRMIRTPLGSHINVDESLNEVSLFLPYYDAETVKRIVKELKNSEGGTIPTVVDEEDMSNPDSPRWTLHPHSHRHRPENPNQGKLDFSYPKHDTDEKPSVQGASAHATQYPNTHPQNSLAADGDPEDTPRTVAPAQSPQTENETKKPDNITLPTDEAKDRYVEHSHLPPEEHYEEQPLIPELDREKVLTFINEQGYLTYRVRDLRIKDYLVSLMDLASLLSITGIYLDANNEIATEITSRIHAHANALRQSMQYSKLKNNVREMKLSVQMYDAFGEELKYQEQPELFFSDKILERQATMADAKLGKHGYIHTYASRYGQQESEEDCLVDCILFASNDECLKELREYAQHKFHDFISKYRTKVAKQSDAVRNNYKSIAMQGDATSEQNLELPQFPNLGSAKDGQTYYQHLYVDEDGTATIKLNAWECGVIEEESRRPDFVCWVRNPSRASWALTVPYIMNNKFTPLYPDFLIIRRDEDSSYIMDVLEPHGDQYADSLPKAKGLVEYAKREMRIGRIQMIREVKDKLTGRKRFRRLEFTDPEVQYLVSNAVDNQEFDHIFETKGFFDD